MAKNACDCTIFYWFGPKPKCLHQLFQSNVIKIITRDETYNGIEFWIYSEKPKDKSMAWKRGWWKSGRRTRLRTLKEIKLAVELADKHQVRKVRL